MKELQPLLEQLSITIGTTVDHLWIVLQQQAFIEGVIDIVILLFTVIVDIIIWKFCFKFKDAIRKNEAREVVVACVILTFVPLTIAKLFLIGDTITKFVNPEYWALMEILSYL